MAIKYLLLLIFAFVLELFFLSKDLTFKSADFTAQNIEVEFKDSKTYSINKKSIDTILVAKKIEQLKTKKIFYNPTATIFDSNITKTISSKKAIFFDKNQTVLLKNAVNISYQGKFLKSSMLLYDLKNKKVLDSDFFTINSDNIEAKGNHLYFDIKNNIIKAKDIRYKINQKE